MATEQGVTTPTHHPMTTKQDGMALAIVHNRNAARNASLLPRIAELADSLGREGPVLQFEAWAQPDVQPHAFPVALARDALLAQLQRDWARYRLHEVPARWRALRNVVKGARRAYLPIQEETRRAMRSMAIEAMVTDKHIRLWQRFLDSDMPSLIVFEDDAVFGEHSIQEIVRLRERLSQEPAARPVYIDLAGGCDPRELAVDRLLIGQDRRFRRYRRPVTNTACVYLVNRSMAQLFVTHLLQRPWLRLISIDWLMNKLFMLIHPDDDSVLCLHADPPIFGHGSTTGHYISWQT